jgi:hypothetical protein
LTNSEKGSKKVTKKGIAIEANTGSSMNEIPIRKQDVGRSEFF